jgi:hypothetical protein
MPYDVEMEIAKIRTVIKEQIELFYKFALTCPHNGGTHAKRPKETACMQDNVYRGYDGNNPVCNCLTCPLTQFLLNAKRNRK